MRTIALLLPLVVALAACTREAEPEAREPDRGPHGGRWLERDGFAVEVTILEAGQDPRLQVYAYDGGEPVAPSEFELAIELTRFGGGVERFAFRPHDDSLLGQGVVREPHSFDVRVRARYAGRTHEWDYESYEGRTTIAPAMAARLGVEFASAGPGVLREELTLYGTVEASPDRRLHVTPRFAGVVQSVRVNIGDPVRAGQTLALVESNESLQVYAVTSPISGVVTERRANAGERAGDGPLFEVTDFSSVIAELTAFPEDQARLARGQHAQVASSAAAVEGAGTITSLTPVHHTAVPTWRVRVALENEDGRWSPGLFVVARVTVAETPVPVSVPLSALQTFRDRPAVYLESAGVYQVQPLELGRRDAEAVEVRSGLAPGDRYVVSNSYLVKADIEKSGASHDH